MLSYEDGEFHLDDVDVDTVSVVNASLVWGAVLNIQPKASPWSSTINDLRVRNVVVEAADVARGGALYLSQVGASLAVRDRVLGRLGGREGEEGEWTCFLWVGIISVFLVLFVCFLFSFIFPGPLDNLLFFFFVRPFSASQQISNTEVSDVYLTARNGDAAGGSAYLDDCTECFIRGACCGFSLHDSNGEGWRKRRPDGKGGCAKRRFYFVWSGRPSRSHCTFHDAPPPFTQSHARTRTHARTLFFQRADSSFERTWAISGGAGHSYGGAFHLFNYQSSSEMSYDFLRVNVTDCGAVSAEGVVVGGGIAAGGNDYSEDINLRLVDVRVTGCEAEGAGGGGMDSIFNGVCGAGVCFAAKLTGTGMGTDSRLEAIGSTFSHNTLTLADVRSCFCVRRCAPVICLAVDTDGHLSGHTHTHTYTHAHTHARTYAHAPTRTHTPV